MATIEIKQLEWKPYRPDFKGERMMGISHEYIERLRQRYESIQIETADSACGTYAIQRSGEAWALWSPVDLGEELLGVFPAAEDAKAAAQADYEARIRSALVDGDSNG